MGFARNPSILFLNYLSFTTITSIKGNGNWLFHICCIIASKQLLYYVCPRFISLVLQPSEEIFLHILDSVGSEITSSVVTHDINKVSVNNKKKYCRFFKLQSKLSLTVFPHLVRFLMPLVCTCFTFSKKKKKFLRVHYNNKPLVLVIIALYKTFGLS